MRSSIFFGFLASSLCRQISPASEAWFSIDSDQGKRNSKKSCRRTLREIEPLCVFVHGKSISLCAVLGIHPMDSHGSCSIRGTSDESLQDPDAPWFVAYLPTNFPST